MKKLVQFLFMAVVLAILPLSSIANVYDSNTTPGCTKKITMRTHYECNGGSYTYDNYCDHYLNFGDSMSYGDYSSGGCTVVYSCQSCTYIPLPGYQAEQVWISDWPWQELVADPDGSNSHWDNRVASGHWITAFLSTARPAAPGAWTLQNMATNPRGYYNANPVQFLSMVPDWNWPTLFAGGGWGDWSMQDTGSYNYAVSLAHPELEPPPPQPAPYIPTDFERKPAAPSPGTELMKVLLSFTIFEAIAHEFQFSYILYEKPHKTLPGKFYSGRSMGMGDPETVRKNRDVTHVRNSDHGDAVLKAYIRVWGFSTYAERAYWGREQQMIDSHGGFVPNQGYLSNLTNSTNSRREVGKKNINGYMFFCTSNHAFGNLMPYTGEDWTIFWGNYVWPLHGDIFEIRVLP